ncbi:CHAT domain-containing protein [Streptomyces sp. NPDC048179]|uniref:CHAT domain-containing protein n=1 Tax=Streptomyces sp. NPDC048179 TaxID=3365506 RepID=UPI0037159E2E
MSARDQEAEVRDALFDLVQDVHWHHLSEEAAEQHIRSAAWPVDQDLARRLVASGLRYVQDGSPSTGYLMARLLMALSEERWGRGMSSPWWLAADLLVESVRLDLVDRPSGKRLRLACAVADEQIETLRQAGELDELAQTMYAAGILRVHPHLLGPGPDDVTTIRERQIRSQLRDRLFSTDPDDVDPESIDAMPHPVDDALEALPYLFGALGLSRGHERGRCLNGVNEALILLSQPEGEGWVTDLYQENYKAAARLIDPARDPVNALRLRRVLANSGGEPMPDTLEELLPMPLPELLRVLGERETWAVMEQALPLVRQSGRRDLLRQLVTAAHTELPAPRERDQLWQLWLSHVHVLPGDATPCPAEDTEAEITRVFAETMAAEDPAPASNLHLAAHVYHAGDGGAACAVIERLPDALPDWGPEAAAAVGCLLASASAAAAAQHAADGELADAVFRHAVAARHFAVLGMYAQVLLELELMVECADAGGMDEVMRAVVLLRTSVAPRLQAGLFEAAAFALVTAAQRLGSHTEGEQSWPVLLMLHAAAKGLDFSRALEVPGPRYAVPLLRELRQRAEELESRLGVAVPPRLDDFGEDLEMLCYAGPQEYAQGHGDHERQGNLRRSFDRQLSRSLYLPSPVEDGSAFPDLSDVMTALPADTVLISLWIGWQPHDMEAVGPDGRRAGALHLMTITAEGVQDVRVRPFVDTPNVLVQISKDGYRQTMHPFARDVAEVRAVARADPLHREVTRLGEERLDFSDFFGTLGDVLTRLHGEGKRHLCFWAHGPFHYLPFPLLRLAGRPLADDWTVTTVPSPVCVTGPRDPEPRTGAGLVSLGAALGGTPWGLRPEPVLDDHAAAVAAHAGGVTLLGPDATPASFLARTEGARYVHVAAHGAHSQDASWFQCLYLNPPGDGADGRLFAHDVLAHDMRGVDLVTLAACESALGRFDLADNPRGLPAAFLLAGARAVVGCLWPVRTDAATCFFGELYRHLTEHHDTLHAFRHAQSVTRDRFPQYRDWGAFTYHGGWTRPDPRNG